MPYTIIVFAPLHIFYSLTQFFFPCTIFVQFEPFLELDSTQTRTTTKLLLGPLSVARGQKVFQSNKRQMVEIRF